MDTFLIRWRIRCIERETINVNCGPNNGLVSDCLHHPWADAFLCLIRLEKGFTHPRNRAREVPPETPVRESASSVLRIKPLLWHDNSSKRFGQRYAYRTARRAKRLGQFDLSAAIKPIFAPRRNAAVHPAPGSPAITENQNTPRTTPFVSDYFVSPAGCYVV